MRRLLLSSCACALRCVAGAPRASSARRARTSRCIAFEVVEDGRDPRLEAVAEGARAARARRGGRGAGGGRGLAQCRPQDALARRERAGADHPPAARSPFEPFHGAVRGQKNSVQIRYSPIQFKRLVVLACAAGGSLREPGCINVNAGGGARSGSASARGARSRDQSSRRRQLHLAPRRDPAQRRRDAGAGGDGGARRGRATHRRARAVPDGDLRRPGDRSPPVGGPLGDRAHAARPRQAARQRSPGSRRTTRWCASGTARPRRGCSCARITTSCTSIAPARSSRPIPDILFLSACQHETYAGRADPDRGALGHPADRCDAGRRIRTGGAAPGGRSVPARARDQVGLRGSAAALRARAGRRSASTPKRRSSCAARSPISTDRQLLYLRRSVSRRRRGGARQSRRARLAYEQAAELLADGAVAAAGAQPAGASLRAIAPARCARSTGCSRFEDEDRDERDDPWWWYYVVQARDADELLEAMQQPYLAERLP